MPVWLKKSWPADPGRYRQTSETIASLGLHTICESGACPNRAECYSASHATLMLMGDTCTRKCPFCDVPFAAGGTLDPDEPEKVALAIQKLGLKYVVLTSVTRDDLADGGAGHIRDTLKAVRNRLNDIQIEVLIPDFAGRLDCVDRILEARPDVLSHNVETIPRFYKAVRPGSSFERSLAILSHARKHESKPMVKSGLMLGLGETQEEVCGVFAQLKERGCEALTLGQYLQPPSSRMRVKEYISPQRFDEYAQLARARGVQWVKAGPFVRTSYLASTLLKERNKLRSVS